MDEICIDYHELGKRIKDLAHTYSKIASEVAKLAEYTENLDIFWDGDANTAYINRISEDLTEAGIITAGVRNLVNSAKEALNIYLDHEKQIERIKEEILNGA